MKTLYLCGAGNAEGVRLALNVRDATDRWQRLVILDDDPAKHGRRILDVTIEGPFSRLAEADAENSEAVNLVARSTSGRRRAEQKIASYGVPFASLVDPTVDLRGVELGRGVTIYRHATASALSKIGDGAVVFAGANAGHGARLGAGSVLAPGAVVNARVELGEGVYVGTNASIMPDLRIGDWATVAANSAVIQDVPEGLTVIGVPAQVLGRPVDTPPPVVETVATDETIEAVQAIWQELLDPETLGPDDNFFDVGGTSALALQLQVRLQATFGRGPGLTEIFQHCTVRRLATWVSHGSAPAQAETASRGLLRRQWAAQRHEARRRR